jgi:hypothetical protein
MIAASMKPTLEEYALADVGRADLATRMSSSHGGIISSGFQEELA